MPPNPRLVLRSVKPHSKPVEPVDLLDGGGAKLRRHFAHNSTGPYPISNMESLKLNPRPKRCTFNSTLVTSVQAHTSIGIDWQRGFSIRNKFCAGLIKGVEGPIAFSKKPGVSLRATDSFEPLHGPRLQQALLRRNSQTIP
jgi:hypothetical protein